MFLSASHCIEKLFVLFILSEHLLSLAAHVFIAHILKCNTLIIKLFFVYDKKFQSKMRHKQKTRIYKFHKQKQKDP